MKSLLHALGRVYVKQLVRREYVKQSFVRINERPIEYRFVFEQLNRLQPRTILDVGTGTTALPQMMRDCGFLVTATDKVNQYWGGAVYNRHYFVIDDDIRQSRLTERYDVVTCISTLEHIPEHEQAVAELFKLVSPGGHLILTCPYNDRIYVANAYDRPNALYGRGSRFICQSFSHAELNRWLAIGRATVVEQEFWRCFSGEYWAQGELVRPPVRVSRAESHQHTCLLLKKAE